MCVGEGRRAKKKKEACIASKASNRHPLSCAERVPLPISAKARGMLAAPFRDGATMDPPTSSALGRLDEIPDTLYTQY